MYNKFFSHKSSKRQDLSKEPVKNNPLPNFTTLKMDKRRTSIMFMLRPVLRVNQIVGVCPHEIRGDRLIFRWSSANFVHTIITLVILSSYFLYVLFQFSIAFYNRKRIAEMAYLAYWLAGSLIAIGMLVLTIKKRDQFSDFFDKIGKYKVPLCGMINYESTRYSRKLYALYICLAIISCIFVTFRGIRKPHQDNSIMAYLIEENEQPSWALLTLSCLFQCYIVIVKASASAFVEVLCSSLAQAFVVTVKNIIKELRSDIYKQTHAINNIVEEATRIRASAIADNGTIINFIHSENPRLEDIEIYPKFSHCGHQTPYGLSKKNYFEELSPETYYEHYRNRSGEESTLSEASKSDTSTESVLLLAIQRFQCVENMQRHINRIFGPILALNTALLVFMCCVLLYLQIKYFGSGTGDLDIVDGIIFTGNSLSFIIRLVIVFISLGDVHETSMYFHSVLTQSLMKANNPNNREINLILIHLTTNTANPVCFSAGGFFVFSRGSLLAVFSIVITYLIFLLQAGG